MRILKNLLGWVRLFGIQQIIRIIQYSILSSWKKLHLRISSRRTGKPVRNKPGELTGIEATIGGVRCRFENAALNIDFLSSDMARINWEPGQIPYPYAIEKKDWGKVHVTLVENNATWQLTSPAVRINIGRDGSLKFLSTTGQLMRQEFAPEMIGETDNPGWISHQKLRQEECLYGLGEQTGPLNLRGTSHRMWNTDPRGGYGPGVDPIYMPLPVYMSVHEGGSYLVFYENTFPAIFD